MKTFIKSIILINNRISLDYLLKHNKILCFEFEMLKNIEVEHEQTLILFLKCLKFSKFADKNFQKYENCQENQAAGTLLIVFHRML